MRVIISRRRRSCDPQGRGKVTLLKSILSEKVERGNYELRELLKETTKRDQIRTNNRIRKVQLGIQAGVTLFIALRLKM